MNIDFKKYFLWRIVSSIGDEVWAVSLPVILAGTLKVSEIGQAYSFGAIGTLIGFFLSTWVGSKFNEAKGSLYCDLLQSFLFLGLALIFFLKLTISLPVWCCVFFIVGLFGAIWFSLSEAMINILNKSENLTLHKWNYLAGASGPILGPVAGGIIISIGSFFLLPLFNAISFFGQALQILRISKYTEFSMNDNSRNIDWREKLKRGVALIFKEPTLRGLTAIPLIVKISLIGLLPFIAVKITQSGFSPWVATTSISCFAVGSILGGLALGNNRMQILSFTFSANVYAMVLSILTLALLYAADVTFLWAFVGTLFIAGFVSSQYTIQLRTMRQKIVPSNLISSVISAQNLLVRLATPISGILFGQVIFSNKALALTIYTALVLIAFWGIQAIKKNVGVQI